MRVRIALLVVSSFLTALSATPIRAATVTEPVTFTVSNPLDPTTTHTVRGVLVRPDGCSSSVLLALHGLSYGAWAWDFPLEPETYSTARGLAARGYAMLAIDRLGYGTSDRPNGYTLTVESYADITRQIVEQLRAGTYIADTPTAFGRVGLVGHSAGSEIVELAAGFYPGVADVLIPTGYQHAIDGGVSNEWLVREWITGDVPRSLQDDYQYFETDPETRARDMYNLDVADPAVVAKDNEMANLTPSGEVLTISEQPSRWVMGSIEVPVLLVLAEKDALFPSSNAETELSLFSSADDRMLHVVPGAGHVFQLHPNAPATTAVVADWLDERQDVFGRC